MKKLLFLLIVLSLAACSSDEKQMETEKDKENSQNPHASFHEEFQILKYTAPENWESEKPSNQMRKSQYKIPGVDGADDALMTVIVFPGKGGSVEANLNRWYGQFKQPDGSNSAEKADVEKYTNGELRFTTTMLTGTYLMSSSMMMGGDIKEMKDFAMYAAIVETGKSPWFFKAVGPAKTIEGRKDEIKEFFDSIKL